MPFQRDYEGLLLLINTLLLYTNAVNGRFTEAKRALWSWYLLNYWLQEGFLWAIVLSSGRLLGICQGYRLTHTHTHTLTNIHMHMGLQNNRLRGCTKGMSAISHSPCLFQSGAVSSLSISPSFRTIFPLFPISQGPIKPHFPLCFLPWKMLCLDNE